MKLVKQSKPAGTFAKHIDSTQLVWQKQTSGSFECVSNYSCIFYIDLVRCDLKNLDSTPCYSLGVSTIFALPAVSLVPPLMQWYNFKVIQNPGFLPVYAQNWIICGLCHARHTLKISERSIYNFLSYLANTQTNRQTKSDKNITSLPEVIINLLFQTLKLLLWFALVSCLHKIPLVVR